MLPFKKSILHSLGKHWESNVIGAFAKWPRQKRAMRLYFREIRENPLVTHAQNP